MRETQLTAERLQPFGTTIFSEMTRLAIEHKAINLSQGFPDFEGPKALLDAVADALRSGDNQYARSMGHPRLVKSLAALAERSFGLSYDPMEELVVTSGATECIASSMLGLVNPGDEVILFEPFYDSYPAAVRMAGGVPVYCTLEFPDFAITEAKLRECFSDKTKALVINTPHNPTGRVFSTDELALVAKLAIEHDVLVISDEVYEHLTYDGAKHIPIATLPGMRDRTWTISSAGKTFSFTGWKIGWGMGPANIRKAVQSAHQFVTFATSTPIQAGLGAFLETVSDEYFATLRSEYTERRDFLVDALTEAGLEPSVPKGTYFILARFTDRFEGDDLAFAKHLIEKHGVAAIPPSAFYKQRPEEGRTLIRFAFCKQMSTLEAAAERLREL